MPIEDVKVGDEVIATDPETGETAGREVTNLHLNVDTELTKLTVADAVTGEQTVLETTQNHPFWDATEGEWVEASKLTPGHRLLVHDEDRLEGDGTGAGSGGGGPPTEIVVVAVDNHTGSQVMRDLTVADISTYHVLAGDEPVLVHNNDCNEIEWENADDPRFPDRTVDTDDQDPFPDPAVVRSSNDPAAGPLRDGDHHYVVRPGDEVRSVHNDDLEDLFNNNIWPGHTSLAGWRADGRPNPVLMAGTFTVRNGRVVRYSNWSGHYQPRPYGNRAPSEHRQACVHGCRHRRSADAVRTAVRSTPA